MGSNEQGVRLNQMGIAVMLFDPVQLPASLRDKADLHRISEGKSWVLKEQAKVFLREITDPLLRKHFCTFDSGQGIVVRVPPASGKKGYYELSPYFKQALKDFPFPKDKVNEKTAQDYVRRVISRANYIRGQKRSGSNRLVSPLTSDSRAELSPEIYDSLLSAARKVLQRAYAPYSRFRVGAAVLTEEGEIFTGCNVENASYGLTICAERSAIFTAVAQTKAKKLAIRAVAVVNGDELTCSPCGACRQVIFEFGDKATIIFKGQKGYMEMPIAELLPESFRLS